ncbi:S1 RNA-binding domain-containing protein [Spiroplasma endosymbiont of Crioceris asparagi]|uniref:S1 RNA-binding domain-containing protein n=1 Tax=Spiroplasma endosymbiont of Crioceris asparagi TaxID=3066286 RepID=UPI0030D42440
MYKKDQKIMVKVTSIVNYGAFCETLDQGDVWKGLIHISELSDFFVNDISEFLNVGDEIEVSVISSIDDKRQLKLSYKAIRPELLKKEQKIVETGKGAETLKNNTKKSISK